MSSQQGLSGLNAASQELDVLGNNIANVATVGYKASEIHFSDVFAASLSGSGASPIGTGVKTANIVQQFSQGNISATNNPLDLAINGGGFFRVDINGTSHYTRNGQFQMDRNGFIVNDGGAKLSGFPVNSSGVLDPSAPGVLQISTDDIPAVATGASVGGTFQGVKASVNLDARESVLGTWANGPATGMATPVTTTYNYSTAVTVFDSQGIPHNLTMYFEKAAANSWNVRANVDGTTNQRVSLTPTAAGQLGGPLGFSTSGVLTTNSTISCSIDLAGVMTDLGGSNSAATPLVFDVDFTGSTQFGNTSGTNALEQDGYSSGSFSGLGISKDGLIQGKYSNGQSRLLGQVLLANFPNLNGLAPEGNNLWAETSASGLALLGAPTSGRFGSLQSSSVEESNTDMTGQLVRMITAQRNYQANAQTIKTQDQIAQTLINLR
ncbi:MAG: flagellar hook protein FlgE [Pseudomonadota bacterium]